ncbi:cytochrome c [Mesorhizobium sp. B2-2-4]|uniref:c-type cytochrome n=1 Tax=unclassified Mesorhizobium TaxID=325217 RepID=UPI00112DB34E|nr:MULTISPECIES: cytochrome c [unclassified Mesorhizobium]MCA0055974.1 cytochrome c [Mesorhizobium sp. B261B1A]TPL04258.1 cytochrome c [Mesorhizobium sp. B2-4-11]TPL17947.1 cytochrome c [Mesorhizobium sp. B2-4-10]TPL60024.1 cytochrome c [Mesorhizobium sp. B2-4-2]TPM21100.1 cytochrome c [Mesorhizobium sp. B2-3-6]
MNPRLLLPVCLLLGACKQDMADQPRYDPLETSREFADGMSARTPVEGTVTRDADLAATPDKFPYPITMALLQRGQQRFDIFCSPCHGRTGDGHGMVVRRGFPPPPTYHQDALRKAPDRHFYDVITDGYGAMYPYAARVEPRDRWAIVAYIRALQYSRHAAAGTLPESVRAKLDAEAAR